MLEDDEIEDEELDGDLEDEFEEDEEEFEPVAVDEVDVEEEVEDFVDDIDEDELDGDDDDDDRILFELKRERDSAALLSAKKFFSNSDLKGNGGGNGNGKEFSLSTAKVWGELGNVFFSADIFEGALFAYEKAFELDSKFGLALNNLALLHVRNGEYLQAVELCRKGIDLLEDSASLAISWNNLGNTYRALKEYDQAEQAYRIADELDSGNLAVENWTRHGLLGTSYS